MKKLAVLLTLGLALGLAGCTSPTIKEAEPSPTPTLELAEITEYSLQASLLVTEFAALIHNPNKSEPLCDIEVSVAGIGEDDIVLAEQSFTIGSLLPDETWVLTNPFSVEEVIDAEFVVTNSPCTEKRQQEFSPRFSEDSYSNADTQYHTSDTYGYARGTADTNVVLTVPSDAPYSSVRVCAAYFAESGKFIGAECEAKDVFAGRKNGFNIYAFIQPEYPSEVRFFARYLS